MCVAFPSWVANGNDLTVVSPDVVELDQGQLEGAIDYFRRNAPRDGARQMIVLRRGKVVWAGSEVDQVHGVWSCTKSFTSTVLGLLIDEGRCALDTPVGEVLPELKERYPELTLRHLTTMTSGYRAVGDDVQGEYRHGPSGSWWEPAETPLYQPGEKFAYWDSAMNLLGLALQKLAGESLEAYFRRRIAEPLGMPNDQWRWGTVFGPNGDQVNGGAGNHGGHLFISARQLARFGQLVAQRGDWNGEQLIPGDWLDHACRVQVPWNVVNAFPPSDIPGPGWYGFNWWVNGVGPDGQPLWPGVPADAFAARGYNNNRLFVIRDWEIVIVRLGLDQSGEGGFKIGEDVWGEFLRRIGEARLDSPTAEDPVKITETHYEGRPHLRIETPSATYYYDRHGGGFSRLLDRDGRDWIAFHRDPLNTFPESAAAGYRGIPNFVFRGEDGGAGHPGFEQGTSEVVAANVIRSRSRSGKWQWSWTFSHDTARCEMERVDSSRAYWFLYEGPIAGRFAPALQVWKIDDGDVRSESPNHSEGGPLRTHWNTIALSDPACPRWLEIRQEQADSLNESFSYLAAQQNFDGGRGMVVVGFGRDEGATPLLRSRNAWTIRFVDSVE